MGQGAIGFVMREVGREGRSISIVMREGAGYRGILVPKLTLGPFLTLSVRNGPNMKTYPCQE